MDLKEHSFFSCFDAATAARLAAAVETRTCRAEEVIFRENDPPDSIYLVLDGHVEIQKKDPSGQKHVIALNEPDDCFGEFGILDGQPRSAAAVAADEAVIARLSCDALIEAFRSASGESVLAFAVHIINKFRESNDRYVLERLRQERMSLVGHMANEIVHDFKNPFSVICLIAGMLAREHKDQQTQRFCELIEEQIRRMQAMTDELHEFSKGKTQLRREAVALDVLLDRFEFLNRDYLSGIDIELSVQKIETVVELDPDKILRVLQNLVNNAADSFKGKPGRIAVRAENAEGHVLLFVSDNGPGIPPEIQPTLFEAFATYGKKKGLGLGMAIARTMVVAHGGEITFETGKGQGTTFRISLPLKAAGGSGS
ncbi:MAG: cyclic nucleotide-binding domain-containing protein [Kiritimatiellae bacterium]|nr:cyclic nucleotide-binding domain-containing protein [Kiritimatiellia bacterium]